ncbi:MAG: hypothetical protein WBO36_14790 [Saprospiraceae bacterium]
MAHQKEETASFVLRLSQKIFETEEGQPDVQWRGNIRHIQSGDEVRFSNFEDAQAFVQQKLSSLTMKAIAHKSDEEQKGIITKSFEFWKKIASATPKLVMESIKDPKKQAAQFQEQIQEQIHQFSDAIGQKFEDTIGSKLELEQILNPSKSDIKDVLHRLEQMAAQIAELSEKVDQISVHKAKN